VYGAVYDADLNPVVNEEVLPFPAWLASLPKGSFEILSTGFAPFQASLAGTQFENVPVTEHRALAGAVGQIAETLHCAGEAGDPAMLDANYVRRSDAELMWKEP
jgi:tRNA threonylcarbamoyladenosine biosynthesis protein TsaB